MLTLQDHIRDFLTAKQQENLALNTLSYYQSALSKFADYLRDEEDGLVSLEALSAAHIRGYIDTLQEDLSPGGVHARLRALRVFFN